MKDEDRGDPTGYDLKVYKEGEKLETKYFITPSNKAPVAKEIETIYEATSINLAALFDGKDPFKEDHMFTPNDIK